MLEFSKNIKIWKIAGRFTILRKSRNWKILKMRQIIKIVITRSILELGPSIFAWKLIKVPFTARIYIFGVFHNFGVFHGVGGGRVNPPKIEDLCTKSRVHIPDQSFFMLGTWFFAWELIFHRCQFHLWGTFKSDHSIWGFGGVKDPKNSIF